MSRLVLVAACAALLSVAAVGGGDPEGPVLGDFTATSSAPFAGDRTLLATVSPDRDGRRDRVRIGFRLDRRATVTVSAAAAESDEVVFERTMRLAAGAHTVTWAPAPSLPRRTYVVRFDAADADGRIRSYGYSRPAGTPVVRVLGIEAAFRQESYAPGRAAVLELATDEPVLTLQVFRSGADRARGGAADAMNGEPVSAPVRIRWGRRDRPGRLRVWVGDWPTGLYHARLTGRRGRTGYAPFVVLPRRLGEHRVAVVMPTTTWQAYNFRDDDGDAYGDTWYAGRTDRTRLARPYLDGGVPPRFRSYDLAFLVWLRRGLAAGRDRSADVLSDTELANLSGPTLARLYDLIVFPSHHEYVTPEEFRAIRTFRNLGGNLIYLSANNFFWCVERRGRTVTRVVRWREVGQPEAELTGVQYVAGDRGGRQGPFVVRDVSRAPWLFEGTGLVTGSRFGRFGIEIDATAPSSPPGTIVLAEIPDLFGPDLTAQMTYYETPKGAKVFSAGAFTLAGDATQQPVARLLDNLWDRLSRP